MVYPGIQRLVEGVRQQSRARSKVFNMSMEQAQDLANELTLLLLRENELLQQINQLQTEVQSTQVVISGGGFK